MIKLFKPSKYYNSVFQVNYQKLFDEGIKVIACDLDNTLVPHDVDLPDENVKYLVNKIQSIGLEFIIISNNNKTRVKKFADPISVDYNYSSKKPLPGVFHKIAKKYNVANNEIALVGDQIMTDVFGANSTKVVSVLVRPLAKRDIVYTKINRFFERIVLKLLAKKKLFKDGEFYE
ncbi:YqeG family HAD IIIA-type phosphatase [Mycoplasma sp. P36-A1]|uniref:YqeG family HAD IIIA-type phosphatase n=1 Tax=Mycoplasma sp. P36-A1 TaxID=3252900 RepID=UPI003C301AEE